MANILDFGADRTGVKDSTKAIQDAINTGEFVYVPTGRYRVAKRRLEVPILSLVPKVRLFGDGASSEIFLDPKVNETNGWCGIGASRECYGAVVENLTLNGSNTRQAQHGDNPQCHAIFCHSEDQGAIQSCRFQNLWLKDWYGDGIYWRSNCWYLTARAIHLSGFCRHGACLGGGGSGVRAGGHLVEGIIEEWSEIRAIGSTLHTENDTGPDPDGITFALNTAIQGAALSNCRNLNFLGNSVHGRVQGANLIGAKISDNIFTGSSADRPFNVELGVFDRLRIHDNEFDGGVYLYGSVGKESKRLRFHDNDVEGDLRLESIASGSMHHNTYRKLLSKRSGGVVVG